MQYYGENGIIKKAQQAKELYQNSTISEEEEMNTLLAEYENMMAERTEGGNSTGGTDTPTEPDVPTGPVVTLSDGTQITLTKDNVYKYLGKKVTNYTGQSSVEISEASYTVSTEYRLYYVDFDNKYGDGKGTIYLKAECTSYGYSLPTTGPKTGKGYWTESDVKTKVLNPSLYVGDTTSVGGNNKYAVDWLMYPDAWTNLADTTISDYINYIVGSPSLEMMIDSYNTHYQLTGDTPDYSAITEGERRKLFYKYTSGATGYQVGPDAEDNSEYGMYTSYNSVYPDTEIGTMYYPGDDQMYWLSSPSANSEEKVICVYGFDGGYLGCENISCEEISVCPLVSLKSGVQLQLQ